MTLRRDYRAYDVAQRMVDAARALLDSLYHDQRARAALAFESAAGSPEAGPVADSGERENWHYVPRPRLGLSLKEMEEDQRARCLALVATGLSARGNEKAHLIIEIEDLLGRIEGAGRKFVRDNELYYISVFGEPASAAWGWRFEGHHISLNFTVVEGRYVAPTPLFFGSNPAQVLHGEREGLRALREEEDLGRELLLALDKEQRPRALIQAEAPPDILTRELAYVEDRISPEGIAGAELTPSQRQILEALIETYVGRLPEEMASAERERVGGADSELLHFAWAGAAERGKGHYYRVQGPLFLAEYDNTQNDANHIHTVWRDTGNDFGQDLLRRHYSQSH